jgi:pyridoxine 5-phosphate synthase
MTKLSVNINKIATLRNSRGENNPDVLKMAKLIENLGADGITVHPRPDERHIKKSDVILLKNHLNIELNVEGYPSQDFINFIQEIKPAQVTLVPDAPNVLTSNAGFKLKDDLDFVKDAIRKLKLSQARVSIFIDPHDFLAGDVSAIKNSGTDRVELYTKEYANNSNCKKTLDRYKQVAILVNDLGIGLNAGHDLSLDNLKPFLTAIPFIKEVSVGHALICDALIIGIKETIRQYLAIVR